MNDNAEKDTVTSTGRRSCDEETAAPEDAVSSDNASDADHPSDADGIPVNVNPGAPSTPEELQKKAQERDAFLEELLRARADLDNHQKRVRRERPLWEEQAVGRFVNDLLPVVDNFERALESIDESEAGSGVAEGVRMIYQMTRRVLEEHGVEEIPAEGMPFDPEMHEAMVQEEVVDRPTGEIIGVLEKGYRYRSMVIRPSKVKVALNVGESGGGEPHREPTDQGER